MTRPFGVSILYGLLLLAAAVLSIPGLVPLAQGRGVLFWGPAHLVLAFLLVVASGGLLAMRLWAWWLAVAVTIGGLVASVSDLMATAPAGELAGIVSLMRLTVLAGNSLSILAVYNDVRRPPVRYETRRRPFTIGILGAFLPLTAWIASSFAILALVVGLVRLQGGAFGDVTTLLETAVTYVVLAGLWAAAGYGVISLRPWGSPLALSASLAGVVHGVYRLSESPPLGLVGTYGGWPATGMWLTTILGGLGLLFSLLVLRSRDGAGDAAAAP